MKSISNICKIQQSSTKKAMKINTNHPTFKKNYKLPSKS